MTPLPCEAEHCLLEKWLLGAVLRLNLDLSLKTTWFHSTAVQFPRARHHSKRRRRWVGVKGSSRNGPRDPKCFSARCLRMVREDIGAPSEGATCAWMVVNEAVSCARVFLRWGGLLNDCSVESVLNLVLV
ncbi:UNVERIFIED_CONTAM: hypothetical protein NCL1_41289 [Trichonephila clavipes]